MDGADREDHVASGRARAGWRLEGELREESQVAGFLPARGKPRCVVFKHADRRAFFPMADDRRAAKQSVLTKVNTVLATAGLNDTVWSVRDCDSTLFVLMYKKIVGKASFGVQKLPAHQSSSVSSRLARAPRFRPVLGGCPHHRAPRCATVCLCETMCLLPCLRLPPFPAAAAGGRHPADLTRGARQELWHRDRGAGRSRGRPGPRDLRP